MKVHTSDFKDNIKLFGKEIDSKITYTLNNEETVLDKESLNAVTPHYEGDILKSAMKQLDIDSNIEIPVGTELNYQFGVLVDEDYEYINFGNYIVYSTEKQEDTRSWKIVCYDKMLYAMKDYEDLEITYPITIRDYLSAICTKLGITFASASDTFVNYDKEIESELYLTIDEVTGNYESLDYTFRDVLDEIAGATASTICINQDDELEVRYINDTEDTIDEEYLKDINVNFGEKYGPVNSVVFSRSAESDSIFRNDETSIEENGLKEIKIKDNQILNGNNRDEFIDNVFNELNGFEYYVNDFSSTGIGYYDLCDRYTVSIDGNDYSCVMLNDEFLVTQGLVENVHTDMPKNSETDYSKADKTDRRIRQAYIIVDKVNQEISSVIASTKSMEELVNQAGEQVEALGTRLTQTEQGFTAQVSAIQEQIDEGSNLVKTTSVTVDNEGITVATDTSEIETNITNEEFKITHGDDTLAWFGYDNVTNETKSEVNNLTVDKYFIVGNHRVEAFENDGEAHTGFFYIGGS